MSTSESAYSDQPDPADIDRYLSEDVGSGDLTANILPQSAQAVATVVTRERVVLCGKSWFAAIFDRLDSSVQIHWFSEDGDEIQAGGKICTLTGNARALMTGERTALNLLQTLSATATLARSYARAVADCNVKVLDTRKTLPGLRQAQKYAVRCGGCHNHRIGLYDAILIKENHILAAGSIALAFRQAQALNACVMIEVEVETLGELVEALQAGAKRILLDEFDLPMIREAVSITAGQAELEVSGNVSLENLREIAQTGVNYISIGALTKNVRAVDLSMRVMLDK